MGSFGCSTGMTPGWPPEHDLWSGLGRRLAGESFTVFLDAYLRAGGVSSLHMERFAFYLLRRSVEDMAACLHTLLKDDADERDDDLWLYGMQAWGFKRWSNLDQSLATIQTSLQLVSSENCPRLGLSPYTKSLG